MPSIAETKPQPPADYAFGRVDPDFSATADGSVRLWRYMDLAKLLSLLTREALFFSRVDLLGDPFEGSLTRYLQLKRERHHALLRKRGKPIRLRAGASALVETRIANTIISCWHMNDTESAAMWRLYVTGNEGVAIV